MPPRTVRSYNGTMTTGTAERVSTPRWSVGGLLLEGVATRDFDRVASCFEPDATMRALLPPGLLECNGVTEIVGAMRRWFGGAEELEVLDGTVGEVGGRVHVAWQLRVRPAPSGDDGWHVIAQQAYLRTGELIESVDLLCSGFERVGDR